MHNFRSQAFKLDGDILANHIRPLSERRRNIQCSDRPGKRSSPVVEPIQASLPRKRT
jgi:hypothetical protein